MGRDERNFRIISDSVRRKIYEVKAMKYSNRRRVLYVDDNVDACFMLSTLLGFSGIDVLCAYTIKDAFRLAENEHFDVYLLDNRFPDGSGLELCRQLRELSPQTPIVFYSGDAYETDRQKALAAGAQAYVVKPEIDKVVSTLLQLMPRSSKSEKGDEQMIYRIYKVKGRIGTGMEKSDKPFVEMQDVSSGAGNQTSLATFDDETNTIQIFNDNIIDVSSIVQKFKNHCDLPNNHKFSILHK